MEEGVLAAEAPIDLIEELAFYLPFARLPYRKTPAEIQWILKRGVGKTPSQRSFNNLRLVCFRNSSKKTKPSFSLFADEAAKAVILSIRGTKVRDTRQCCQNNNRTFMSNHNVCRSLMTC